MGLYSSLPEFNLAYIPANEIVRSLNFPLQRYLPPAAPGVISTWLKENIPLGSLVVDPFGVSPWLVIEAAAAGYRVIVSCNNRIVELLIRLSSYQLSKEKLLSVISLIGDSKRNEERLEQHLRGIYTTRCRSCDRLIEGKEYHWTLQKKIPNSVVYECKNCGDSGEYPLNKFDTDILDRVANTHLSHLRAYHNLGIEPDWDAPGAHDAINSYTARSLYFIFSILNKFESLQVSQEISDCLALLLLNILDEGNFNAARNRPRQFSAPQEFTEKNLWTIFEYGANHWAEIYNQFPVLEVTKFPQLPSRDHSISIFRGDFTRLSILINSTIEIKAIFSIIPRPTPIFWTYATIWSGWIWGDEAIQAKKYLLQRKRFDWVWLANTLFLVFQNIKKGNHNSTPIFFQLPEVEVGFLVAFLSSLRESGLSLLGLAVQAESDLAQALCVSQTGLDQPSLQISEVDLLVDYFRIRNEPSYLNNLHCLTSTAFLYHNRQNSISGRQSIERVYHDTIAKWEDINNKKILKRVERNPVSQEATLWDITNGRVLGARSLFDWIELEIEALLQANERLLFWDVFKELCQKSRGLLTPERELILQCLISYATPDSQKPGIWRIKDNERSISRKNDIQTISQGIMAIGRKIGYIPEKTGQSVFWKNEKENRVYSFYIQTTATISSYLGRLGNPDHNTHHYLVIPGSRARLMSIKLQRDPFLAEKLTQLSCTLIKFRQIILLSSSVPKDFEQWQNSILADPLTYDDSVQMTFL